MIYFFQNNTNGKMLAILLLVLMSFGTMFVFQSRSINKSLRLVPLANGWVSEKAALHLSSMSLWKKYQKTVSHDLGIGRFRPASFIHSSLSYALSPFVHGRVDELADDKPYVDFVTGDLRLQAIIFLVVLSSSLFCMAVLMYRFTGSVVVSVVPIFFISFSPSLTGNLLQNYIDSQEIQLVSAISLWILFLFSGLITRSGYKRFFYIVLSFLFLSLVYLTKETSSVIFVSLSINFLLVLLLSCTDGYFLDCKQEKIYFFFSLMVSLVWTVYIYFIVVHGNTEYGTGFDISNVDKLLKNFELLWRLLATNSVNVTATLGLFFIAFIALVCNRKRKINGIPVRLHMHLWCLLVFTAYGFFLIQLPWQYALLKYLLPSLFLLSFAVSHSIVIVSDLLFYKYRSIVKWILVLTYLSYWCFCYPTAQRFTDWYYEAATYGVSIVDEIVNEIDSAAMTSKKDTINVFVEFGTDAEWGRYSPWGKLQLMRILSIEKGYNMLDNRGRVIFNISMPEDELTSFRYDKDSTNIYLTNRREELSEKEFDVVYKGFLSNKDPSTVLSYERNGKVFQYLKTQVCIRYKNNVGLAEFYLQKYLPRL